MPDVPARFAWIQPGALADYHAVIGGPVTQPAMMVREAPFQIPAPRGHRGKPAWCAMLKGKSGWVACDALTPAAAPGTDQEDEATDEAPPEPVGWCPRCGAPAYVDAGFCGGCGHRGPISARRP